MRGRACSVNLLLWGQISLPVVDSSSAVRLGQIVDDRCVGVAHVYGDV